MKIEVKRIFKGTEYTIGKMFLDGKYFCDTLEDAVRQGKIMHETAIDEGEYKVKMSYSNRFKRVLPELLDVPNFAGIRIHKGNHKDHTSGCILLGENKKKGMVINSAKYETELCAILAKETDITIIIS